MKLNCHRKNQNINTTQPKKFIFRVQIQGGGRMKFLLNAYKTAPIFINFFQAFRTHLHITYYSTRSSMLKNARKIKIPCYTKRPTVNQKKTRSFLAYNIIGTSAFPPNPNTTQYNSDNNYQESVLGIEVWLAVFIVRETLFALPLLELI